MESSFDVLEWDSTSKEQDSLVHRLFGDISTSDWSTAAHEVNASKREKIEASKNEKAAGKSKKKRKDKRENNKFKIYQKVTSEQPETKIGEASDENVDLAAATEIEESVLVHETSEKTNCNESKKTKKKKRRDQIKQEDMSDRKEKNQIKTDQKLNSQHTEHRDNQSETVCDDDDDDIDPVKGTNERASIDSVNQSKEAVDSAKSLNAESIEEPNGCESKKAKKKKRREKRKVDDSRDDSEFPNMGEHTPETNDQHKRRKKTSESEQDGSHEEQMKKCSPNKDTNSNILSLSAPRSKSSLHEKMMKQLESSRFRWINEQLYSTTGDEAVTMFAEDPNLFDIYHRGFTNQVKLWPVNPVDKIIEWLKKRPTSHVVADFGCGEAVIAQSVTNKVHSFDLVAKNKFVTACNMAKVPLSSASVDVAVFCLSLMGTDLVDFLKEAHRVLKPGSILKVAEVSSRINDTAEFTKSLSRLGFKLQNEDTTNKMFVLFDFIKNKDSVKSVQSSKLEGLNLKPCIYKKR